MPSAPPPPPHSFYTLLATFLAFPLHAPLTLLVLDAPFGKFAWDGSWLNVHGNTAWVVMEAVSVSRRRRLASALVRGRVSVHTYAHHQRRERLAEPEPAGLPSSVQPILIY